MAKKRCLPVEEDLFIPPPPLKTGFMRQAVLAYLAGQAPAGLALRVPARISKYYADVAAFWMEPAGKVNRLERTVAVDVFRNREECAPNCEDPTGLMKELREIRKARILLENRIREEEPELCSGDELFAEFTHCDFSRSRNREYREIMQKQSRIQHALFKGGRLEMVRQARVADYLYLALPKGELEADEVADGWGLLHIYPDGRVKVAKVASRQLCTEENRMHFALNIAAAGAAAVCFANGLYPDGDGAFEIGRCPRRRRKP